MQWRRLGYRVADTDWLYAVPYGPIPWTGFEFPTNKILPVKSLSHFNRDDLHKSQEATNCQKTIVLAKVGTQICSVSLQIEYPHIHGLIPQSQVRKFLRCTSLQIANPHICNDYFANFKSANFLGVPVRKSQIPKFASQAAVFLIHISIGLPLIFSLPT